MNIRELLEELDAEVEVVLDPGFEVEIVETDTVPNFDDPAITYDNLDSSMKKCKRLESCVLYVDIRNSAAISATEKPVTLARMYSTFVRSMIRCARYFGGHVRNIIGDRVMVVFDREGCFASAVDTAILMNTVAQYIINRHFTYGEFTCGIGIDYGKMLIVKGGAIRRGAETEFYRSLVWLGAPANVASRLTDLAHKTTISSQEGVYVALNNPYVRELEWHKQTLSAFLDELEPTFSPTLKHKDSRFSSFFKTKLGPYSHTLTPILIAQSVYKGLKNEHPDAQCIVNDWWTSQNVKIDVYDGTVYGADIHYVAGSNL